MNKKEYQNEYYMKNRETMILKNRLYYYKNKAQCIACSQRYFKKKQLELLKEAKDSNISLERKRPKKKVVKPQIKYKVIDDDSFILEFN
jgi:hypothetical protein